MSSRIISSKEIKETLNRINEALEEASDAPYDMSRMYGKTFPLRENVVVDRTSRWIDPYGPSDEVETVTEGTIVEFVFGNHGEEYHFRIKDSGSFIKVREDDLRFMDINPIWY